MLCSVVTKNVPLIATPLPWVMVLPLNLVSICLSLFLIILKELMGSGCQDNQLVISSDAQLSYKNNYYVVNYLYTHTHKHLLRSRYITHHNFAMLRCIYITIEWSPCKGFSCCFSTHKNVNFKFFGRVLKPCL